MRQHEQVRFQLLPDAAAAVAQWQKPGSPMHNSAQPWPASWAADVPCSATLLRLQALWLLHDGCCPARYKVQVRGRPQPSTCCVGHMSSRDAAVGWMEGSVRPHSPPSTHPPHPSGGSRCQSPARKRRSVPAVRRAYLWAKSDECDDDRPVSNACSAALPRHTPQRSLPAGAGWQGLHTVP